jgi:hypothetical protein
MSDAKQLAICVQLVLALSLGHEWRAPWYFGETLTLQVLTNHRPSPKFAGIGGSIQSHFQYRKAQFLKLIGIHRPAGHSYVAERCRSHDC